MRKFEELFMEEFEDSEIQIQKEDTKANFRPTTIEELYGERKEDLKSERADVQDNIYKPFTGDEQPTKEYKIEPTDDPQFMLQIEIDQIELQKELEQAKKEREEVEALRIQLASELAEAKMANMKEAEELVANARMESTRIKEDAYAEGLSKGYDEGYANGKDKADEEYAALVSNETILYFKTLQGTISTLEETKHDLIRDNVETLKEVAVAIAEKIVQVSLQSSGEVIRKMILKATDKMHGKEWVKIYISKLDSAMFMEVDYQVRKDLELLSPHIKIEAIDNAEPGTCIIELPDQRIDASVNSQLEVMKSIVEGLGYGGAT
ncbi:MAG: FliH/SctL family protein [Bacillota bacterium]